MDIFIEIGIILFIATIISSFMRLLRQPLIIGYILTGVIIGPYFLDIVSNTEYIELFSKLGIAILLFIVGLSLRPDVVREVGKVSLITGLGQIFITSFLGFLLMKILGFDFATAFYGSIALTFSSTIIILKLLGDKRELGRLHGKISIGFLLVQDVIAAILLLIISVLGKENSLNSLEIFSILLKGTLFFFLLYFVSKKILPKLSTFLAKSQESLFLFSITWGLGMAGVFYYFGFSLEIGALIAGVTLSVSPFSEEISSRTKPLRDFFILLFFVMLGYHIVLANISYIIFPAIILSLFVLVGNPLIVLILMNLLGYKTKTGFFAGLNVAQISEFSLILMALVFSFGKINQDAVSLITLVGIITISISTYLIMYSEILYEKFKKIIHFFDLFKIKNEIEEEKENSDSYNMIIFGYDRVGYDFVNVAQKMNSKHLVVDFDPISIKKLNKSKIPNKFGDADDVNFLEEIKISEAEIIISTIPDFKVNLNLVSYYHNHNPKGIIIVTSHDIKNTKELYEKGASFVVMPYYLGAKYASHMIETHKNELNAFEKEKEQHLEYLEKREKHTH